jgi:hypothetical protein
MSYYLKRELSYWYSAELEVLDVPLMENSLWSKRFGINTVYERSCLSTRMATANRAGFNISPEGGISKELYASK